jgi:hypothetical protein
MAHFAELNSDNIVTKVIVVNNDVITVDGVEDEQTGIDFCKSLLGQDTNWIQCSYNNSFRNVYPTNGSQYDEENDVFILPQPYPSWSLDSVFNWQPPVPYPNDIKDNQYIWDEDTLSWVEASI